MAAKKLLTLRNGYWSKQIKGKRYYFGKDYDAGVAEYLEKKPYLELGIENLKQEGSKVKDLLNAFLKNRRQLQEVGQLSQRTLDDYIEVCDIIASCIPVLVALDDLKPQHFDTLRTALQKGIRKPLVSVKKHNTRLGYARTVFAFASNDSRFVERPLPFKSALACISKLEMRKYRSERPARSLTAEEINAVLDLCSVKMKAIVLLAINGGYNNSDIAKLDVSLFQPTAPGLLVYPRRKTFFMRQTPLWQETIDAVDAWVKERPKSRHINLFLAATGNPYNEDGKRDQMSKNFRAMLKKAKIYKPGKNFGALRTTFANVAKEVGDDVAVKALMGHSDGSTMYENYAKGVFLPRLMKITDHVHDWLFGDASNISD